MSESTPTRDLQKAHHAPAVVHLTSPLISFLLPSLTIFEVVVISQLIRHRSRANHVWQGVAVVMATYVVFLIWAFAAKIETTIDVRTISRTRGFGPLKRTITIALGDIEAVEVPNYSNKLVARLRGGKTLVVANQYTKVGDQVPDVPKGPGDAGGHFQVLRRIRFFIDERRGPS